MQSSLKQHAKKLRITNDIFRATDRGEYTVLVMLDLCRTFATIHYDLLIYMLKYLKFSNNACSLIENYLKCRQQQVLTNNINSEYLTPKSSVQQGIFGLLSVSIYSSHLLIRIKNCNIYLAVPQF